MATLFFWLLSSNRWSHPCLIFTHPIWNSVSPSIWSHSLSPPELCSSLEPVSPSSSAPLHCIVHTAARVIRLMSEHRDTPLLKVSPISLSKIQGSFMAVALHGPISDLISYPSPHRLFCPYPSSTLPIPSANQANSPLRAVWVSPWKSCPLMYPWLDPHFMLVSDQMSPCQGSFPGSSHVKQHPCFTPQVPSSFVTVLNCISKHPHHHSCYKCISLLHLPTLKEKVSEHRNFACFVCCYLQDPGTDTSYWAFNTNLLNKWRNKFIILSANTFWLYAWHYFNCWEHE